MRKGRLNEGVYPLSPLCFAMPPFCLLSLELLRQLHGPLREVARLVRRFRQSEVTPQSAFDFEQRLFELLREVGRCIVEWAYNDCEPRAADLLPARLQSAGAWYRRNDRLSRASRSSDKTANRDVATLFGKITLMRYPLPPRRGARALHLPAGAAAGFGAAARATAALAGRSAGTRRSAPSRRCCSRCPRSRRGVVGHLLRKVTAAVAER